MCRNQNRAKYLNHPNFCTQLYTGIAGLCTNLTPFSHLSEACEQLLLKKISGCFFGCLRQTTEWRLQGILMVPTFSKAHIRLNWRGFQAMSCHHHFIKKPML
jgi:hypothetical protein